jgi:hypothetical protein
MAGDKLPRRLKVSETTEGTCPLRASISMEQIMPLQ